MSEVAVPTASLAADELFAAGRLNAAQRDALDQVGNRNGRYDVGDFLAWIEKANIILSPTVMSQVMGIAPRVAETAKVVAPTM